MKILALSLSADEYSPYWLAKIELAELADLQRITLGDSISLQLGDTEFVLRVDGKSISRPAPAQLTLTLSAISPLAWLAPPHALLITRNWATPVMARDAVATLLPDIAIDWQLLDWLIPAGRLSVNRASAVDAASQIVAAAGGVIESQPDGSVLVRHLFPVAISDYPQATAELTLTEEADLFELSEQLEIRSGSNHIRVSDGTQVQISDSIEYLPASTSSTASPDPHFGTVRLTPFPWRPLALTHTGSADVVISAQGEQIREESELVEFQSGQAHSRYVIDELISIRWQYADLGTVTITPPNTLSASTGNRSAGYSLAQITYRTRCWLYHVHNPTTESIQFLGREP